MSWLIWPFLHTRPESIREPQCRQMLLELSGPSLTRLSGENLHMESEVTYRHPHLIDHVASTFILLNASCSEGSVRRWWVALNTLSCSSPFGRCFSTSRHENKSADGRPHEVHGVVPSSLDLLLNHHRARSPLGRAHILPPEPSRSIWLPRTFRYRITNMAHEHETHVLAQRTER